MNSTTLRSLIGIAAFILAGVLGYHLFPSTSGTGVHAESDASADLQVQIDSAVKAVRQSEQKMDVQDQAIATGQSLI